MSEGSNLAEAIAIGRRREVQMMGAAISLRNWHDLETAYNQLRDRIDRALGEYNRSIALASFTKEDEHGRD